MGTSVRRLLLMENKKIQTMSKEKKTSTESKSVIKENLSVVPLDNSTTVIFEIAKLEKSPRTIHNK